MAQWAKIVTLTVVAALALYAVLEPRLSSEADQLVRDADLPAADAAAATGNGAPADAAHGGTGTGASDTTAPVAATEDPNVVALQDLQDRIQADPADAEAWELLGGYFLTVRDYPRAAEAFAAALEFDESDAQLRADLGMALLYQGLVRVGRAELVQALALDDTLAEAHLNLGITYSHASPPDLEIARVEWERVIELAPDTDLASQAQDYLDAYTVATTDDAGTDAAVRAE